MLNFGGGVLALAVHVILGLFYIPLTSHGAACHSIPGVPLFYHDYFLLTSSAKLSFRRSA